MIAGEFLREQFEQHGRGLPAVGEDGAGGGAADGAQSIHPLFLLHRYDRDAGSNSVRFARLPELFRPAGVFEEKSGYCRVIPGAEPCDRFAQRLFEIDAGRGDSRLHLIGDRQQCSPGAQLQCRRVCRFQRGVAENCIRLPVEQALQCLPGLPFAAERDQQLIPGHVRFAQCGVGEVREVGVGQIADHQPQRAGASPAERTGRRRRPVAEFGDGAVDALARLRRHPRLRIPVQILGDQRKGDSRQFGDIFQRRLHSESRFLIALSLDQL